MKNACTFLNFRNKMGKLTDSEKFWVVNKMVYFLVCENAINYNELNYLLRLHLSKPIQETNSDTWWWALRTLSSAPAFYKTLRLL
jgi:hypothetical protein